MLWRVVTPAPPRITLLGRVAIARDAAEQEVPTVPTGRRAEVVFAYLVAAEGRSVSRDELAEALWPAVLPDTWNAALRGVLSDVRKFLERGGLDPATTLTTEQGRLRLELPPGMSIDLRDVRHGTDRARSALGAGDPSAAAAFAIRTADAAQLPFLPFQEDGWAAEIRAELDDLHLEALRVAADAQSLAGDPRAALATADRLVRADPYAEDGHRLRIALLGETGDRAGALKAFEHCKAILQSELGISPSPETADALRIALQGGASPAVGTDAPSGDTSRAHAGATPFASYSVLVVEDHDFQRRTTLTLLRALGVTALHEASDGATALQLLDGMTAPDVIVCDLDMPGMDGVEFIRNVAERQLATAVVIASGLDGRVLSTVRAASEGYGLQVLGAVGKPLTSAALERMLEAYRPPRRAAAGSDDDTGSMSALASALADGSLAVVFEPIVDLGTGRVTALRPTVRWPFADDLLSAADDAGLGRSLVEHLLREARAATRRLELDAFVELSPELLTDVSLADALAAISRDRVVLVAGAGALASHDSPAMLDLLARLRLKGYGLCVDGFDAGTLERLPLTHVQLPTELVAASAVAGDATALIPAVDAARVLGAPLVGRCATSEEFELLLSVGCSFAHGPFLAPAVPAAQLEEAVAEWTAPPVTVDGPR